MQDNLELDDRVIDLAADALQQPAEERELWLQQVCNGDAELRRAVDEALALEIEMGPFLTKPWLDFTRLPSPFEPGEKLKDGRFEIVREIGQGGMGVVYAALDHRLNLKIAIKAAKPGFQRLLTPELTSALKVRHPNICLLQDVHTEHTELGEIDFLSMELLDGITLAEYLEEHGPLAEPQARGIARQLCAGLAEAHRSRVIHRDLKTGNVILCPDDKGGTRAVITDFGLAGLDPAGIAGTPRYIAPEIWEGKPASKASDIYALGVILYELVKGPLISPPLSPAMSETEWQSCEGPCQVPPPKVEEEGLSKRWVRTLRACLQPDPDARPADALQVLAGLEKPHSGLLPLLLVPVLLVSALLSPPVWNRIHNLLWPPPALRLVVLPPAGAESSAIISGGALQDVSRRLSTLRSGARSVIVIPPGEAKELGAETPEQALKRLHATHALQTSATKQGDDTVVQGTIIDVETQTHVRDFSFRYNPATLGALPGALAGEVSSGLGLQGVSPAESLSPAATAPYDRGTYLLYEQGTQTETAVQLLEEAARLDPRSPLPLAAMVDAEIRRFGETKDSGHITRAENALQTAESLAPDSVSVHLAAGKLYENTGKLEKALEEYLRVKELAPANLDTAIRSAWVYHKLDMPDKAIGEFRRAIALNPKYYRPYGYFGVFYFERGNCSAAIEQFQIAIQSAPGLDWAWSNLAACYERLGRYPEAEQALSNALKLRTNPGALNNLGLLLESQGKDEEAVSYYQQAIALKPNQSLYRLNLADEERRLGRMKAARAEYRQGLRLIQLELQQDPQNATARSLAAYCGARLGDRAWAEGEIAQAVHSAPGDERILRQAVLTYEALALRDRSLDAVARATPEILRELDHERDLADLRQDPRFRQLVEKSNPGGR